MDVLDDLERGRRSYANRAWTAAFESLSRADEAAPLSAEDRELLARSAYMLGRDDDYRRGLERAYTDHVHAGDAARAARCAWWIGHNLLFRGETAPATGWFRRGQRLLDREAEEHVERGYLLIPRLLELGVGGDQEGAFAVAEEVAGIAERFDDADLLTLGLHEEGRALVRLGRSEEGLRLIDEAMVAAMTGDLSPIVVGIVYCSTIAFCREVYELGRARQWTDTLSRWCEGQPDMVAHMGLCLVHRAEVMELEGAWDRALDEARRAAERFADGVLNEIARGKALYRQGEIHRLRGERVAAEEAYRAASRCGLEPQPGLALLRLAEGNAPAAAAAIRRALEETSAPLKRAALLPAHVEIMLAADAPEEARDACGELVRIAERQGSDSLDAIAAQAVGAVALADGDPRAALVALRRAEKIWRELAAPYEVARVRLNLAFACRALGDEETAALELEAARATFAELGAASDLLRVDSPARRDTRARSYGLTARELEVLRLVVAGKSNHAIAVDLVLSDHTVRRHVQNIFHKLGVSTRAAATAFAFEHELMSD